MLLRSRRLSRTCVNAQDLADLFGDGATSPVRCRERPPLSLLQGLLSAAEMRSLCYAAAGFWEADEGARGSCCGQDVGSRRVRIQNHPVSRHADSVLREDRTSKLSDWLLSCDLRAILSISIRRCTAACRLLAKKEVEEEEEEQGSRALSITVFTFVGRHLPVPSLTSLAHQGGIWTSPCNSGTAFSLPHTASCGRELHTWCAWCCERTVSKPNCSGNDTPQS